MIAPSSVTRWQRALHFDAAGTPLKANCRPPTSEQAKSLSRVLYWDRHIIVHNKEGGRDCQNYGIAVTDSGKSSPGRPHLGPVLQDVQERFHLPELPYQAHRLDKNTTGALLLARTSQRAKELARDFRQHKIHKTYHALVRNLDDRLALGDSGKVTVWHHLDLNNRPHLVPAGTDGAREGKTSWRVMGLSNYNQAALLELKPTTGFKHQLRLTCAHELETPILGDLLHGGFESVKRGGHMPIQDGPITLNFRGMFLHASKVAITRFRRTGSPKRMQLTIGAPLPPEWIDCCNFLGITLPTEVVKGGVWIDEEAITDGRVPELDGEWVW